MPEYNRPGVYIEEISKLGNSVVSVPTAVPAFVGYTERAVGLQGENLTMQPTRISSMLDYMQRFGGPNAKLTVTLGPGGTFGPGDVAAATLTHQLFYQLQLFYANGGGNAWIVSVGSYENVDKAKLLLGLGTLDRVAEATLLCFPDAAGMGTDIAGRHSVYTEALAMCAMRKDRFLVMDLCESDAAGFRTAIGTSNLAFGAVYTPELQSSLPWQVSDAQVWFASTETGGAVGVLKGKTLADGLASTNTDVVKLLTSKWVAALRQAVAQMAGPVLQPSGSVLGVYACTDAQQGVWKAPANVALNGVVGPVKLITDQDQDDLNVPKDGSGKSINAIRRFRDRGTLVWGARTLDGNSNDWRYIQVRRTVIYIEQSIKQALQPMVFEPNDAGTWMKVRSMTEAFLANVWREGGLAGAKPADAFTVQCGLGQSMTTDDILNGRLIVNIALAVTRPAEFIFITLTQTVGS